LTATITPSQSLSLTYKHWQWVSSTGKIPYADNCYTLTYHLNATKQLGLDLTAKYGDADYTYGSVLKTSSSCLRDDAVYSISAGVSYAFTPHFSTSLGYGYDFGRNQQNNAGPLAGYREFDRQLVSLSAQFKF
jgi:long-subunit fatty acid transport protein